MRETIYSLLRPGLFGLEAERAHAAAIAALECLPRLPAAAEDGRLATTLLGATFPNPIGLAAGFDKDARVPDAILALGFGFAEAGTLTPKPQDGNPRPRLFRLTADRAVINRLGFNNGGHAAALRRLEARERGGRRGLVAINVGANKDSADRIADYVAGVEAFAPFAAYIVVNISSPNTPGLRDLQGPAALDALLARVMSARDRMADRLGRAVPIAVKLAPDIADEDLEPILACLLARRADAAVISNTTLRREGLADPSRGEAGGLSGAPLFARSTRMLARAFRLTGGSLALIGVGGVDSGDAAIGKIEAGASLVQLYTGLVYEGPGLVARIKRALRARLRETGTADLAALRGRRAAEWSERAA